MEKIKISSNNAFTLAEVLITLSIIGIVAALTIPSLIANYKKLIYVTEFKKFYSEFQQGITLAMTQKDCNDLICTNAFDTTADIYNEIIAKSFKIAKNYGANGGNMLERSKKLKSYSNDYIQSAYNHSGASEMGESMDDFASGINGSIAIGGAGLSFLTADNFLVEIWLTGNGNCDFLDTVCAHITVDVNGFNGPCISGRDVFQFWVLNDGTLMADGSKKRRDLTAAGFGLSDDNAATYYWKTSNDCQNLDTQDSVSGYGCAGRIVEEGFEMNY